jgi:hypothetical protein
MTYYNRKKDLANRALMAVIVISIGLILMQFFSSCAEEEDPDLFLGEWEYESTGQEPNLEIDFKIRKDNTTFYKFETVNNGGVMWLDYSVDGIVKSSSIERVVLAKDQSETNPAEIEGLVFFGLEMSADGKTVSIDSVIYKKGLDDTYYYDQKLRRTN